MDDVNVGFGICVSQRLVKSVNKDVLRASANGSIVLEDRQI